MKSQENLIKKLNELAKEGGSGPISFTPWQSRTPIRLYKNGNTWRVDDNKDNLWFNDKKEAIKYFIKLLQNEIYRERRAIYDLTKLHNEHLDEIDNIIEKLKTW